MKIYLIRHGHTTSDTEGRFGGYYEDYLTEKGKEQTGELRDFLQGLDLEIFFHSPKIRAKETLKIISEKIQIPAEELFDLRERNAYGVVTGLTESEAQEKFPEELLKIKKDKIYHDVLDSEPYEDFRGRVVGVFQQILKKPYSRVGVITHGGVIGTIMRDIFNYPKVSLGDCGVIEIDYKNENDYSVSFMRNATLPVEGSAL